MPYSCSDAQGGSGIAESSKKNSLPLLTRSFIMAKNRQGARLESSIALTTKPTPDIDGGELVDHPAADLLQRELAHIVEEEVQGGEQDDEEDHDGEEVGKGNQH